MRSSSKVGPAIACIVEDPRAMLSFLQQLQMARHSLDHDERQLRHLQETYNLIVKVVDIKDEKFSNKGIKQ